MGRHTNSDRDYLLVDTEKADLRARTLIRLIDQWTTELVLIWNAHETQLAKYNGVPAKLIERRGRTP